MGHCVNSGDLTAPLSAILFMNDYPESIGPIPVEDAPVFHSLRFPQEVDRLFSIAAVANSFKPPTEPTKGITMGALMESLGPPLVLNLEKVKIYYRNLRVVSGVEHRPSVLVSGLGGRPRHTTVPSRPQCPETMIRYPK